MAEKDLSVNKSGLPVNLDNLEQSGVITFDDRRTLRGNIDDISPGLVKQFLKDIRSHLVSMELTQEEIYEKLELLVTVNDDKIPRNVALLFFNGEPDRFFRGTRIDVVQFGGDADGDLIHEKLFYGPLPEQIYCCLKYLEGISGAMLQKIPGQAEVERTVPYPYGAVEEAIVNAVYHRSYEYPPEPIKIYLYSDRMEITSYPGPVPGIRREHFQSGHTPAVPARNRKIGEMLKDLRLAEAVALLERTFKKHPGSGILAGLLIEYASEMENHQLARQTMTRFEQQPAQSDTPRPYLAMTKLLLDRNKIKEAEETLKQMPLVQKNGDISEIAILEKRISQAKHGT
ncbi:MAG: hypothetical protein GY950_29455 [bacterium]|nr:hypothetical protein [bacterium]